MRPDDIHFEERLSAVEEALSNLRRLADEAELGMDGELDELDQAYQAAREGVYSALSPWQTVWLARHPKRPSGMEYVDALLEDCIELHSDRIEGDDPAISCGLAWFDGTPIVYLAHGRGRNTKENIATNFGMMHPRGYRKARRVMDLAAKFNRPIVSFVDTQAAHPGAQAETRGQAMAIAENLYRMAELPVPVVVIVVGQGGSGGALGVGVGNVVLMLQYAVYCVAPPEACSGIIWKDSGEHAPDAAVGLKLTADDLYRYHVIDEIIEEPMGGAHRDAQHAYRSVREALQRHLDQLTQLSPKELVDQRYRKFRSIGVFDELTVA